MLAGAVGVGFARWAMLPSHARRHRRRRRCRSRRWRWSRCWRWWGCAATDLGEVRHGGDPPAPVRAGTHTEAHLSGGLTHVPHRVACCPERLSNRVCPAVLFTTFRHDAQWWRRDGADLLEEVGCTGSSGAHPMFGPFVSLKTNQLRVRLAALLVAGKHLSGRVRVSGPLANRTPKAVRLGPQAMHSGRWMVVCPWPQTSLQRQHTAQLDTGAANHPTAAREEGCRCSCRDAGLSWC